MTIHPVRPTGTVIAMVAGHHRGTMAVMAGTAPGTIPGIVLGTIPGMTHGTMAATATMVGHRLGTMAGMVASIVREATMAGIPLYIIMVAVIIVPHHTGASMPIVT